MTEGGDLLDGGPTRGSELTLRFGEAVEALDTELSRVHEVQRSAIASFRHTTDGARRTVLAAQLRLTEASDSVKLLETNVRTMVTRARGARQRARVRLYAGAVRAAVRVHGELLLLFLLTVLAVVLVIQFDDALLRFIESFDWPGSRQIVSPDVSPAPEGDGTP